MTEKNDKKKIISLVVLCVSIVALTTSLTYAYFVSQVGTNEQEKITIKSGDLALTFRDNDETVENIEGTWNFGDSIEKELVIENTGTKDAYAKISWDNLINTYLAESLAYTLEEKSDDTNAVWKLIETENVNVPRSESVSTQLLAEHLLVPAGHTYTYRVKITFEDLEDIDQTQDLNAKFITKFTLDQGTKKLTTEEKLANLNIKINPNNPTNFANPAMTDETANGLFSMEDDYGTSYYYRGTAPNNYIKFGQNASGQDMWWRIIRFNGDGSIRIQYDGVSAASSNTYTREFALTNIKFNSGSLDAKYVGWMYGGKQGEPSTSKEEAQRNETDSEMKLAVERWYKENIVNTGYSKQIADRNFCNDRSGGGGYGNSFDTYFRASYRLDTLKEPSLKCPDQNDSFTVEDIEKGNGALTYPVGLITADENSIAGAVFNVGNTKYYLRNALGIYYTMTPYKYTTGISGYGTMFSINSSSSSNTASYSTAYLSLRAQPVINLKAEFLDKLQGKGTIDNPYFIKTN